MYNAVNRLQCFLFLTCFLSVSLPLFVVLFLSYFSSFFVVSGDTETRLWQDEMLFQNQLCPKGPCGPAQEGCSGFWISLRTGEHINEGVASSWYTTRAPDLYPHLSTSINHHHVSSRAIFAGSHRVIESKAQNSGLAFHDLYNKGTSCEVFLSTLLLCTALTFHSCLP